MKEEWQDIISSNYAVSSTGRVRNNKTNKILKPFLIGKKGNQYLAVDICPKKSVRIHKLVARYFIGDSELQINHKNGNKPDNSIDNLEYCTAKENVNHAWKLGLSSPKRGNNNGVSKISEEFAYKIKYSSPEKTHREWADQLGVSQNAVNLIRKGKNWSWL